MNSANEESKHWNPSFVCAWTAIVTTLSTASGNSLSFHKYKNDSMINNNLYCTFCHQARKGASNDIHFGTKLH